MAATVWTLDTLSFNSGPDGGGVEWWADVPTGWHTPRSTGRVVVGVGLTGALVLWARDAPRTLQATAYVLAPSYSARWAAQNALEAIVEAMITVPATLQVDELVGSKSVEVRYIDGMAVTVRSAVSFTFLLPVVALDPAKTLVP